MPSSNQIKCSIGGPESTPGIAVARDRRIPLRSFPTLPMKIEKKDDPVVTGRNMSSASIPTSYDVSGSLPIAFRPVGGIGAIIRSVLGDKVAPVQVSACMRLRYTGTSASQKFVADGTANTVTSLIGTRGSEAADPAFGTPGYQDMGLTGKVGSTDTGLANSTTYNFKVTVDGGSQTAKSITTAGTGTVTFTLLLALLNAATTNIAWTLVGGDLRAMSKTVGAASAILIEAGDTSDLLAGISASPESDVDGVTGVLDFDDARYDTLGEVVALATVLTNYDCEKVFGADAADIKTDKVEAFTAKEGKNTWCYVWFLSSSSGVYKHEFKYQTATTEHSVYSVQLDGFYDNFLYDGVQFTKLALTSALKGFVEADADYIGMKETDSQVETAVVLDDVDPMTFADVSFTIGAVDFNFIRNLSITFDSAHNAEGYGTGSLSRQYHEKTTFSADGTCNIRLDSDAYALRAGIFTRDNFAASWWYKGGLLTTDIYEMVIVDLPYCSYDNLEFTDNSGVVDAKFDFKPRYPKGTLYNNPVTITMITADSGQY